MHSLTLTFGLRWWGLPRWITRPVGWDLRFFVLRLRFRRRPLVMRRLAIQLLIFLLYLLVLSFIDSPVDDFLCAALGVMACEWARRRR